MKHILPLFILVLLSLTGCSFISGLSAKIAPKQAEPARNIVTEQATAADTLDYKEIIAGNWIIMGVDTVVIDGETEEEMPYVNFDVENNMFYASNGCNILNGNFLVEGATVKIANVLSTMKYCGDIDYDGLINEIIRDGKTLTIAFRKVGQEGYMTLSDPTTHKKLDLRRNGMAFLNGNWQVMEIDGEAIEDEDATIFFDIAARRVHGNTGCNFFNGEIVIDPAHSNAVSFEKMGVTKRMCQKHDQERNMMLALEAATVAVPGENGTALLTDSSRKHSMTLRRLPIEK